MIRLEAFGETATMARIAAALDRRDGVENVRLAELRNPGRWLVVAEVRPKAVDALLPALRELGLQHEDMILTRPEVVGRVATGRNESGLVWEDVLGSAWLNSRPVATYLAFMLVAGVVACYGVLERNGILIVGAMAVSPDLLPITAVGVAIVGRRFALGARAFSTLLVGLVIATGIAAALAWLQNQLTLIPGGFRIDDTVLGTLTTVNDETIVVALVAGIAGMLAVETRASAGVGVAISVTTIPAAAYLGVATGLGEASEAWGALAVLSVNVVMLIIGASVALAIQQMLGRRRSKTKRPKSETHPR